MRCARCACCGNQLIAVLFKVLQGLENGFDHGARSNGCAGKLVKHATFLFDLPVIALRIADAFADKTFYPVAFLAVYGIAEPRRFPVLQYAHPGYAAVAVYADNHIDITGIALASCGGKYSADKFAVLFGEVDILCFAQPEQAAVVHG